MIAQDPVKLIEEEQIPAPALQPVSAAERIASIDLLRGVALLGILMVNIWSFALPSSLLDNPSLVGGFTGWNFAAWMLSHVVFEQKMMSIFSMLFGAGLIIMTSRSDANNTPLAGVYYRRTGWLLVFGLVHSYGLWDGDILVTYALCGFFLYPFRRLAPSQLIALGLVVFLTAMPISIGIGLVLRWGCNSPSASESQAPASLAVREAVADWCEELQSSQSQESLAEQVETHRGSYRELFKDRASSNVWEQTAGFVVWAGPRAGGLMLLGMALMKLHIFTGAHSLRFYTALAVLGYALGFPIVGFGAYDQVSHGFEFIHGLMIGDQYNYVGSLFVALGHVGLVLLLWKAGLFRRLSRALAAVGRMALSNYLLQTLICTALFDGWGFGLFDRLDRLHLLGVVVAVWVFELVLSPVWLHFFQFGPMEWLWRSLTYKRRQPFLIAE
jgi:uncharacterized protein